SADGERFTLHDVVFQVREAESGRALYVRQTGLGDVAGNAHAQSERLRTQDQVVPSDPDGFAFEMGDWAMSGSAGQRYELLASAGDYSYALNLTDESTPVLHGQEGLVDFGLAGISYYYTRPRLAVEGTLTRPDGEELNVTGEAWMDKQWGDFQPVIVGWDWASVQLDDGADVMVSHLFDTEGQQLHFYATVREPGEAPVHVDASDGLEFEPEEATWTSERTGNSYRTNWVLRVPSHDVDVRLTPLVEGSEFASQVLGVTYWEAGVDVRAVQGGESVGQGFVELNWPRGTAR
ncbi:MAG: lipocalin family protein, partial [Dehalococcoidia bacterium]